MTDIQLAAAAEQIQRLIARMRQSGYSTADIAILLGDAANHVREAA